jgi:hypothetical protein
VKTRTLRGQFQEGQTHRLVVDDGRINVGYKVTSFVIAGDPSSSGNDAWATLSLDYDAPANWNWSDNRQIGWSSTNIQSTAGAQPSFTLVDPDHIVVRDLYIQGTVSSAGGSSVINYLVTLEQVELSDDQAVLALIKERSQDDWR